MCLKPPINNLMKVFRTTEKICICYQVDQFVFVTCFVLVESRPYFYCNLTCHTGVMFLQPNVMQYVCQNSTVNKLSVYHIYTRIFNPFKDAILEQLNNCMNQCLISLTICIIVLTRRTLKVCLCLGYFFHYIHFMRIHMYTFNQAIKIVIYY